jgi:hypothetical protein
MRMRGPNLSNQMHSRYGAQEMDSQSSGPGRLRLYEAALPATQFLRSPTAILNSEHSWQLPRITNDRTQSNNDPSKCRTVALHARRVPVDSASAGAVVGLRPFRARRSDVQTSLVAPLLTRAVKKTRVNKDS